jgi:hypothetical protein
MYGIVHLLEDSVDSEQRIRALCQKVVATEPKSPDFSPVVSELRAAIREHCEEMREKVVELAVVITSESKSAD